MFKRTVSFFRQLVGGRSVLGTADEVKALEEERRARVRYPSNVETTVHPADGAEPVRLSARVRNISRTGINLQVERGFEPGSLLSVELPGPDGRPPYTVLACVVHATPRDGEWALGCTFARELSDDDLSAFGAKRQRPPRADDHRTWVRFPCHVKAACQTVTPDEPEPAWPAQVLNISPSGIGLLVDRPVENGALLSLQLQGAGGQMTHTILACVVHVTAQAAGHWALGCNFIRELSEKELLALL
jgi:hypothetical protein